MYMQYSCKPATKFSGTLYTYNLHTDQCKPPHAYNKPVIKGPVYEDFVHFLKIKYFAGRQPEPAPLATAEEGRRTSTIQLRQR